MAHFAEINGDYIVLRVIAWDDNDVEGEYFDSNPGDYLGIY